MDLFKWGFVVSMAAMWLAMGVGVAMLFFPGAPRVTRSSRAVEQKRAA